MSAIDRRSFLKAGAVAPGIVAFSPRDRAEAERLAAENAEQIGHAALQWSKAPCRYCGTGCGVEVGVRADGQTAGSPVIDSASRGERALNSAAARSPRHARPPQAPRTGRTTC